MKKITHTRMKEWNKRIIVNFIRENSVASQKKIVENTKLGVGTVNQLVEELLKENVIHQAPSALPALRKDNRSLGRKEIPLIINPDYKNVIGCEILSDRIRIGIIDYNRNCKETATHLLKKIRGKNVLDKLVNLLKRWIDKKNNLSGIGIALPGSIDFENKIVVHSPRIENWKNIPLGSILEKKLRLPVYIENEARCEGIAEFRKGKGKGYKNVILLHIGEGVGGAIIIEGKLFRGSKSMGNEIGHISINFSDDAPPCTCGNKGCLESYVSTKAVVRRLNYLSKEKNLENFKRYNFQRFIKGVNGKDEIAYQVFEEITEYLSVGIGNLLNIFNPEIIIIEGEIVKLGDKLKKTILTKIKNKAVSEVLENVRIEISHLGEYSATLGAGIIAFDNVDVYS